MDTKYTEVYPYGCDAEECDYKKQWVIRRIISEINLTFN